MIVPGRYHLIILFSGQGLHIKQWFENRIEVIMVAALLRFRSATRPFTPSLHSAPSGPPEFPASLNVEGLYLTLLHLAHPVQPVASTAVRRRALWMEGRTGWTGEKPPPRKPPLFPSLVEHLAFVFCRKDTWAESLFHWWICGKIIIMESF